MSGFRIKLVFVYSLVLLCSTNLFAQLTVVNEPQAPSVQASEMTKYGKQDVNLYTGELSLNIPIYTYRDDDFTIPVSLSYSYNGLKVNRQAGFVGLGWTLNFGGYITRQVRGIPDEERSSVNILVDGEGAQMDLWGSNYNTIFSSDSVFVQVLNRASSPKDLFVSSCISPLAPGKRYEYAPDIYHFNFMGHVGSFVKDSITGKYNVFNTSTYDSGYTVTLKSEWVSYSPDMPAVPVSGFDIRTSDGYVYHFGSFDPYSQYSSSQVYGALEREVTKDKDKSDQLIPGTITAWALRSITAPNGRYVEFVYDNDRSPFDEMSVVSSYGTSLWFFSENEPSSTIYFSESLTSYLLPVGFKIGGDYKVEFDYSVKDASNLPLYINGINDLKPIQLDRTYPLLSEVKVTQGELRTSLNYVYNSQGSPYPFLSVLDIDSVGIYTFSYKGLSYGYFPPLNTTAKDHWGYLNKTGSSDCQNNYLYPSNLFICDGLTERLTPYRNPNFAASSLGLMTTVSYPTGGYSSFEWESNTFTSKVAKTSVNSFVPVLIQDSGTGPGGRIKQIVNCSKDGTPIDSTSYNYTCLVSGGQTAGSGTLLVTPRYSISYGGYLYNRRWVNTGVFKKVFFYSDGGIVAYDGIPVEYSEVEQVFSDGSSTRTRFTSWANGFPDEFRERQSISIPRLFDDYPGSPVFLVPDSRQSVTNILLPPVSHQWRRGKILSQTLFDALSNKLRETENIFSQTSQRRDAYEYIYVGEEALLTYRETGSFHQSFSKVTDYLGNKSAAFSSGSSYNAIGLKITDTTTTLAGDKTITEYLYLWDKNESQGILSPAEDSMMVAGWYSMPLELKTTSVKNGIQALVSHDRYTYRKVSGSDSLNFKPVAWEKKDVETGQWYTYATYKYDKYGRMIQKTDANGISTVFVWSSEHLGPSLRIDNATVSEVSSVISGCFYSTGNSNAQTRAGTIKNNLPKSEVTWFKWYEYGLPEDIGDPSGRITHYTYDVARRLHYILDDSRNPVEKYDYQTSTRQE